MTEDEHDLAKLLPHAGAAILLDAVVACTDTGLAARVTIRPGCAFHQDRGVPVHVGIEYMAQACAAFSGLRSLRSGAAPRMGFLLGTRRYLATRAWFADGQQLVVEVDLVYRDDEIGVFDCRISAAGEAIATAQLMVTEPQDVGELLGRQGRMDDG